MLLYILLILGQAFASQQLADQIYNCVNKFAQREAYVSSPGDYTVREVTESCRDDIGANSLRVTEAKLIDGSTHYIKLTWNEKGKEVFRHYAFNIKGTKLCNGDEGAKIKSLSISLREILNKDQNSFGFNACKDVNEKNQFSPYFEKYGFGFQRKSANGPCIRKCNENEILRGTKANLIYNDYISRSIRASHGNVNNRALGEVFLDLQCVKCPKGGAQGDPSYSKTHPQHNKCYNSDGCEDGYELVERTEDNHYDVKASVFKPQKFCGEKCDVGETRNKDGICWPSHDKNCEDAKRFANNPQKWLSRFLAHPSSVGKCDMNVIKKMAQTYTSAVQDHLNKVISNNCNKRTSDETQMINFHEKTFAHHLLAEYKNSDKCLTSTQDSNARFDPTLYDLISQNPITLELDIYSY